MTTTTSNKNLLFINKQFLNYCNNHESIKYSYLGTSGVLSVTAFSNDNVIKCCNGLILYVLTNNGKTILKKVIDNIPTLYTYDDTKYEISDVVYKSSTIELKNLFDIQNFIKLLDIHYKFDISDKAWYMYLKILKLKEI